ncbi:MAG TPA: FAD-dependent oxidoreductase [Acidimicrobiales bacterium]|nr:FAD-dependent oxidoreductase [Acidimicrobiales bacterium]
MPDPLTPRGHRVPRSADYASLPYWWEGVDFPPGSSARPPAETDIVVVGAGYTGLATAFEAARGGHAVAVVDRDDPARGASSRNGGMVLPGLKHDLAAILAMGKGRALWDETVTAVESLAALVTEHRIECDWQRSGHVELAHHPRAARHFEKVAGAFGAIGESARFLDRDELRAEIGSDRFFGALVVERSASLHPAKWAAALQSLATAAGALVIGRCAVRNIEKTRVGFRVDTERGPIDCRDVVIATNATTGRFLSPWLGRRILPVGSYVIATEPLDPGVVATVNPRGRMFFDSRNFLSYWRLSPDGRRILFGGRTSFAPTTVERARDRLYAVMTAVHPQLAGVALHRAWGGDVALTYDRMPHLGRHPTTGVVYAMGYCGTGVALATHFGRVVARYLTGDGDLGPFAARAWPTVPLPARIPGMLPIAGLWYQGRDSLGI